MRNMEDATIYKVTCKQCSRASVVGINQWQGIEWKKTDGVISGRQRLDGEWGWQCMCGNDQRLSKQEDRMIVNKQAPEPQEIEDIKKNLKVEPVMTFAMEKV